MYIVERDQEVTVSEVIAYEDTSGPSEPMDTDMDGLMMRMRSRRSLQSVDLIWMACRMRGTTVQRRSRSMPLVDVG